MSLPRLATVGLASSLLLAAIPLPATADGTAPDNEPPMFFGLDGVLICAGDRFDPWSGVSIYDDYDAEYLTLLTAEEWADGLPGVLEPEITISLTKRPPASQAFGNEGTIRYAARDYDGAETLAERGIIVDNCTDRPQLSTRFYLNNTWGPTASHTFVWGGRDDEAFVGDWDGDGIDTIAVRWQERGFIFPEGHGSEAKHEIQYGRSGDTVLVGDWGGDGVDTLAVRRGSAYHIKNSISGGPADRVVHYGKPTDSVLVGDWDGDGVDTLAVRRASTYHVRNSLTSGVADRVVTYGRPGDVTLVGDWDGDGRQSFAVRRGNAYHVKNAIAGGPADIVSVYGRASDDVYVGDWDGDWTDTLAVRR